MRKAAFLSLLLTLFLASCAGSGYQRVAMPLPSASVPGDRCRVYVAREKTAAGSIRNVRVFDGDTEIGVIHEDEFLCWERKPERGVGRLVFEGISPDTAAVENVFDLPREPGTAGYYAIRIEHSGRRPEITPLSSEAGKALIEARSPATPRRR
jgi:hypothetical protein